jgi:2'-5' RNA ligase
MKTFTGRERTHEAPIPHVTLARFRRGTTAYFEQEVPSWAADPVQIDHAELWVSEKQESEVLYRPLYRFSLSGG